MSVVMNMTPVAIPCFAPASSYNTQRGTGDPGQAATSTQTFWISQTNGSGGDDPLDFDLLAEYLLDDGSNMLGGTDFGSGTPPTGFIQQLGVVSPDQNRTIFADPLADGTFQLQSSNKAAPVPPVAQAPPALAPAPAPATVTTQPVQLATTHFQHDFSTQPQAHVFLTTALTAATNGTAMPFAMPLQAPPTVAPMPAPPTIGGVQMSQNFIMDQHKRQRVDAPNLTGLTTMAVPTPVTTLMTINGQMVTPALPLRGGRQKTQAQIDRRRERNRILARRTRLRKKFFFESLQKDVMDLQKENMVLKEIVRSRLKEEDAAKILDDCKANEDLPSIVLEHCGDQSMSLDRQDFNLVQSIQKSQQCFIITDPSLHDNPIVYASDDFLSLTGYSRDEVLGRNCRFLQGAETNQDKIDQVRKAVMSGEDISVTFINYSADGTAFWNKLFIAALRDAQNNIVNFIGVIVKVAGPEPGDPEEGKQLPGEHQMSDNRDDYYNDDSEILERSDSVDADAAVMAIEGAVTAAVAAAPNSRHTNASFYGAEDESASY